MAYLDKSVNHWKESDAEGGKTLAEIMSVRLFDENWEGMKKESAKLGIGPTTPARVYIDLNFCHRWPTQGFSSRVKQRYMSRIRKLKNGFMNYTQARIV